MAMQASGRGSNNVRPTTTVTTTSNGNAFNSANDSTRTLRLCAVPAETRHIQWAEDVVDNEGMGKKSSKVCCIYHKPRQVGESSDEDSSDSSSSDGSESEPDTSRAQARGQGLGRQRQHHHHRDDESGREPESLQDRSDSKAKSKKQDKSKRPSPNAYEKMPKPTTHKPDNS